MEELKNRKEIDPKLTWDLSLLYRDEKEWEKDLASLDGLLKAFLEYKGRLADSPETLCKAYEASDALFQMAEKVYVYASLKNDEDTTLGASQSNLARIREKYTSIGAQCSWFSPELLAMEEEKFLSFLDSPILAFYKRSLLEENRYRPHLLSEKEERILSMASEVLGSPGTIFRSFNDADLRFPGIKTEEGNVEVTHGNYITLLQSKERSVRKKAFTAMHGTYHKFRHTLASTYSSNTKKNILSARLRSWDSALEASLFGDNVPKEVYDNLIRDVREGISSLHKYLALRKKVLKLSKLHMYDLYTPLLPEREEKVSWEEAVKWVKSSLSVMGEEYGKIVEKAFAQRWMDVPESRGKRSGAYSGGCYGCPPYMLLNFHENLSGAFTLAHELGHSIHSYYSDHAQKFHYASYRIFVAEVASTTNELLLHNYLMKNARNDHIRLALLNQLMEEIRGTLFRQTMFAEFEKNSHAAAESGTPLTADTLEKIYGDLNSFYFSPVVQDELIRSEWSRIPHFYSSFYVYKYATGISAACALSRKILKGEVESYLDFLRAGSSKDVLDILKDAGVDFINGTPVKEALAFFDETLDEFEKIWKKTRN